MAEQLGNDSQSARNIGEHFADKLNEISNISQAEHVTRAFLEEIRKLPCDAQDEALANAEEKSRVYREGTNPSGIGFRYDLIGSALTEVNLTYSTAAATGKGRSEATLPIDDLPPELTKCQFLPKQSEMR